jgi:protein-L-isoaspartate O-methyltransferase
VETVVERRNLMKALQQVERHFFVRAQITSYGALTQIFGSKSPGGRRIDVPQCTLSM